MQTIKSPSTTARKYLKKQQRMDNTSYRPLRFTIKSSNRLYNLVTGEAVELTDCEVEKLKTLAAPYEPWMDSLIEKYFLVPVEFDEIKWVDFLRACFVAYTQNDNTVSHFVITTTTVCNAKCDYCFQKSQNKITMTKQTAHSVAEQINTLCGGNDVSITWYGGEPLLAEDIMTEISKCLKTYNINWSAYMVTNGFLFSDQLLEKAKNIWNVNKVQITLDGAQTVHNQTKNFSGTRPCENPYQTVLRNIQKLLELGIEVHVRLNLGKQNFNSLKTAVDDLRKMFGHSRNISVHVSVIFDHQNDNLYSDDQLEEMYAKRLELINEIKNKGMRSSDAIVPMRMHSCVMDNKKSVVFLPDGNFGDCYEFAHCKNPPEKLVTSDCADCILYPDCYRLTACWKRCRKADRQGRINQMKSDLDRIKV